MCLSVCLVYYSSCSYIYEYFCVFCVVIYMYKREVFCSRGLDYPVLMGEENRKTSVGDELIYY